MRWIEKEAIQKATKDVITQSQQIIEKMEMVKAALPGFKSKKADLRFQKELWKIETKDQIERYRYYWNSKVRTEFYNDNGINLRDGKICFKIVNDRLLYTVEKNITVLTDGDGKINFTLLLESINKTIENLNDEIEKCQYTLDNLDSIINEYNQVINAINDYNNKKYVYFYTTASNWESSYINIQNEIRFEQEGKIMELLIIVFMIAFIVLGCFGIIKRSSEKDLRLFDIILAALCFTFAYVMYSLLACLQEAMEKWNLIFLTMIQFY